jgi:hypothetical protein
MRLAEEAAWSCILRGIIAPSWTSAAGRASRLLPLCRIDVLKVPADMQPWCHGAAVEDPDARLIVDIGSPIQRMLKLIAEIVVKNPRPKLP